MPTPKIGLLTEIKAKAAALDEQAAASYRGGLRDASEFWRLWNAFSDDVALAPLKEKMRTDFQDIVDGK